MRPERARLRSFLTRMGLAGFLFFLVKGVLWLTIPALIYAMR
jgi:hypothetical protein